MWSPYLIKLHCFDLLFAVSLVLSPAGPPYLSVRRLKSEFPHGLQRRARATLLKCRIDSEAFSDELETAALPGALGQKLFFSAMSARWVMAEHVFVCPFSSEVRNKLSVAGTCL